MLHSLLDKLREVQACCPAQDTASRGIPAGSNPEALRQHSEAVQTLKDKALLPSDFDAINA